MVSRHGDNELALRYPWVGNGIGVLRNWAFPFGCPREGEGVGGGVEG